LVCLVQALRFRSLDRLDKLGLLCVKKILLNLDVLLGVSLGN
jgi:hypothetical protein